MLGQDRADALLERRADPRQRDPVPEQVAQVAQLARGDVGLRQQIGAQQMRERTRVDCIRLHTGGGDRLRAQRVREMQLVARLFEQVGQPLPAVGRLERDLELIAQSLQQLEKALRVVGDPAREQLLTVPVEDGDLRAIAVEIDPDVQHSWASFGPDFDDALGIPPRARER